MHEPEDDIHRGDFTAAAYRAAWARIAGIARDVNNPQLRPTLILMCYTVNPKSGRTWTNYYPAGNVDLIAWDCYNAGWRQGKYGDMVTQISRAITASESVGLSWGIAEYGSIVINGDTAGRAAWLTQVSRFLYDEGPVFASYFDSNAAGTDYRLLDEPSILAWREIISDQNPY